MSDRSLSAPLAGVRVIEACQIISGPWSTMLLAEQGAEVVKIEQPGGDPLRRSGEQQGGVGSIFYNCNRSKRSVVLDLTTAAGREVLFELVAGADVFVQNFRPGKADKLGIGAAALREINPSLIYATITGVGEDGPDAHRPVYDFVIQAQVGLAAGQRDRRDGRPSLVKSYVIDKATAYTASQAITAALFARERDPRREGCELAVSMLDVGLHFVWPDTMMNHTFLDRDTVERATNNLEFYDAYATLDGNIALQPIIATAFDGLCSALGHPEWRTDARFANITVRRGHFQELCGVIAAALGSMTTAQAMEAFVTHDVPAARVVDADEVADQPQVRWNEALHEGVASGVGRVRVPRPPVHFGGTRPTLQLRCPSLGEDTTAVLTELGHDSADVARLAAAGAFGPVG